MKPLCILLLFAASALMPPHAAVAGNAVPSHMIQSIYPPFRTGDLHNYNGEAMIRITRITALDRDGRRVELFSDKSGALLPMVDLENIHVLINPANVEKEGEYHDLKVHLADEVLSISLGRPQSSPLPAGNVLTLPDPIYIKRYTVINNRLML